MDRVLGSVLAVGVEAHERLRRMVKQCVLQAGLQRGSSTEIHSVPDDVGLGHHRARIIGTVVMDALHVREMLLSGRMTDPTTVASL
jgi:hypothetical protein